MSDLIELQSTSPLLQIINNFGKPSIQNNKMCVDYFCLGSHNVSDDRGKQYNERAIALQNSLKWINVQAELLNICIALFPLDLPSYVLLEIVDRFPLWSTHVNRKKKIDYIIQVKKFCDDLIASRQ
jgi:hypothetical protein